MRTANLMLQGWHGTSSQTVEVVGETPKRYRIRAVERTRLAGAYRYINPGQTALVPKDALQFNTSPKRTPDND